MTELVEKIAEAIGGPEGNCGCTAENKKPCRYCRHDAALSLKATIEGLMEPSRDALRDGERENFDADREREILQAMLRVAAEENGIKLEGDQS